MNTDATWRIRVNPPCAAAMRPFARLMWLLVIRPMKWRETMTTTAYYSVSNVLRRRALCRTSLSISYISSLAPRACRLNCNRKNVQTDSAKSFHPINSIPAHLRCSMTSFLHRPASTERKSNGWVRCMTHHCLSARSRNTAKQLRV